MSRITADIRTSPPPDWKPEGLIRTRELWVAYNAARDRYSRLKNGTEVAKTPLEFETTAFWEDLYHKVLLRGYSNNSQQPPTDTSDRRCDIVTRYFDEGSQRRTLLFTEAKRASEAAANGGFKKMEEQVSGYCQEYLRAENSQPSVFACTVVGPYIRCFIATKDEKLEGLWRTHPTMLNGSYLDPLQEHDAELIKLAFDRITKTPPSCTTLPPDSASVIYKSSPPGRVSHPSSSPSPQGSHPRSSPSPKGSSRELQLPLLPVAGPPESERDLRRRDRSLTSRSMSPATQAAGPSGQSASPSYRQRSPPQGSASRQAPRGSSPTPLKAVALVESWGQDFNSTTFLVRDQQSGESFRRLGEEFQKGTIQKFTTQTETVQVPCYFTSHNNLRVFVLSLDPKKIERTGSAAQGSLPKWAKK